MIAVAEAIVVPVIEEAEVAAAFVVFEAGCAMPIMILFEVEEFREWGWSECYCLNWFCDCVDADDSSFP